MVNKVIRAMWKEKIKSKRKEKNELVNDTSDEIIDKDKEEMNSVSPVTTDNNDLIYSTQASNSKSIFTTDIKSSIVS